MRADRILHLLDLQPHPEGGHYRGAFRDSTRDPGGGASGRAHSTAMDPAPAALGFPHVTSAACRARVFDVFDAR
jgi:hypothetical protein